MNLFKSTFETVGKEAVEHPVKLAIAEKNKNGSSNFLNIFDLAIRAPLRPFAAWKAQAHDCRVGIDHQNKPLIYFSYCSYYYEQYEK
jgi:hypothetical protein